MELWNHKERHKLALSVVKNQNLPLGGGGSSLFNSYLLSVRYIPGPGLDRRRRQRTKQSEMPTMEHSSGRREKIRNMINK